MGNYPGFAWIAAALAGSIYAGFPEVAYINGIFVGTWVLIRMEGLDWSQRRRVAVGVGSGVVAGLMLAAPQLWPFVEYLSLSYVGEHSGSAAHRSLGLEALPLTFIPGMYGRLTVLMGSRDHVGWGSIGGYLPALQVLLACFFLRVVPRALAWVWIIWGVACVSKMFDVQPLSNLINVLPMMKYAAVYRYCQASLIFVSICVVVLGVEAYFQNLRPSRRWMQAVLLFWIAALLIMLIGTSHAWLAAQHMRSVDGLISCVAITWALLGCTVAGISLIIFPDRKKVIFGVVCLAFIDALANFVLPLGSAAVDPRKVGSGQEFLQTHLGTQRLSTQDVLKANYGAYFKLAQVQHNYLPIYKPWADYVVSNLQSDTDLFAFIGVPSTEDGQSALLMNLSDRLDAYRSLGVRYMVFGAKSHAFAFDAFNFRIGESRLREVGPSYFSRSKSTFRLNDKDWVLHQIGFDMQRSGNARGDLHIQLCAARCVARDVQVQSQPADHLTHVTLPVDVPFDGQLPEIVTVNFDYQSTMGRLWLGLGESGRGAMRTGQNDAPAMTFHLIDPRAKKVYDGPDMVVYEIAQTRPYFEVSGHDCAIQVVSRNSLLSDCRFPAQLLRREAYYPGWRVQVDGQGVPLAKQAPLFQSVQLPAGHHQVHFSYRPNGLWLFMVIFGLGALLCVTDLLICQVRLARKRVILV
uniref:Bacterial membrane protein YfhO n=1 Tax=Mycena chlorophos TaxID=658473 RepID=A0ABQ0KUA4_MYCCL|nr:predicted protein [Mycena chlorophos]